MDDTIDLGSREFTFVLTQMKSKSNWLELGFEELLYFAQELITHTGTFMLTINVKEIK